jgi:hypothetical protein
MTRSALLLENTSIVLMGLAAVGANRVRQYQDRSRRNDTSTGVDGHEGFITSAVPGLLSLILMSLTMTVDIDRPTGGGIVGSQLPMQRQQATIANAPPGTYDRRLEKPETE